MNVPALLLTLESEADPETSFVVWGEGGILGMVALCMEVTASFKRRRPILRDVL